MSDELRVAYHESGHALALLSLGHRVRRLALDVAGGGRCLPASTPAGRGERVFVALAGAAAVRALLGHADETPSAEDLDFARDEWNSLSPRDRATAAERARVFAWQNDREVEYLARELAQRGTLDEGALAEICNRPNSPLAQYAALYRGVSSTHRGLSARLAAAALVPRGMRSVVCKAF